MLVQSPPLDVTSVTEFGRRRVKPTAVIIDEKSHVRDFIRDALDDIGFITTEGKAERLAELIAGKPVDLLMLGLSEGGVAGTITLEQLHLIGFRGRIMLFGPPNMPMVDTLLDLGQDFGLAMLPLLPTPFNDGALRQAVSFLIPQEPVPLPTVDAALALRAGWLELWYQPKIAIRSLTVDGAEALVRLRHPTWGVMPPAQFLPDDGDPNFSELSDFVVTQASADWHAFVPDHGHIDLSINLPLTFFNDPGAIHSLAARMPRHPAFRGLIVEINAWDVSANIALAKSAARQLRALNIGVSIDDLGADWPFLLEIGDCPFVEIKVDKAFITGAADNRLKQTVCRRIVDMADMFGAKTVAEGVETRADFIMARELGFDTIQGYFFGKPMEARKFARRILREPIRIK